MVDDTSSRTQRSGDPGSWAGGIASGPAPSLGPGSSPGSRLALLARHRPIALFVLLVAAALGLTLQGLAQRLPVDLWRAVWAPDDGDIRQLLVHYAWAPRLVTAWLAGAGLGLAGVVFQQALRNPLASPTTLGVSAGAYLALALVLTWAPDLLAVGREWVTMLGGTVAVAFVFALAWRQALSPLALVLAGLTFSLYCGALGAILMLLDTNSLTPLFIWGGGSLTQQGWSGVVFLAPRLAVVAVLIALMLRPMTLLGMDDEGGRSLGLSPVLMRLLALALGVAASAFVVSAVGVVGFVGLAAPTLAQLGGARRLRDRLIWGPLVGAALLWITDQLVQRASGLYGDMLPTGAATALFGSPLLLWLLPRLRQNVEPPKGGAGIVARRLARPGLAVAGGIALLAAAVMVALTLGRGPDGWQFAFDTLLPWRAPRVGAALAAGAMLAMAGTLMQRLTANPMASPELLGINAGAIFGLLALSFVVIAPGLLLQTVAAACGALLTLALLLLAGRRSAFAPDRMLLAGLALSAFFDSIAVALMASGDPRAAALLYWMSGSTYRVHATEAGIAMAVAMAGLFLAPFCARWLEILPLGEATSRALGVDLSRARLAVMLLTALLAAAATLVVGPLSFIGLLAPHLARLIGFQRALAQLLAAALIGAFVMVAADWLGRNLLFPRQLPAGLLATLIGGPCLMFLLRRR